MLFIILLLSSYAFYEINLELKDVKISISNLKEEIANISKVNSYKYATVYFVGLTENGGVVLPIKIGIREGRGNLFIRINGVTYNEDFQETVKRAVLASKKFLKKKGKDLGNFDVVVWVENPFMNPIYVEGGSMGASISLGIISLVENKKIKNSTIITGGISANGTILKVKNVEEKAKIAKNYGIRKFIVPKGQFVNISGIDVVEVADLEEAEREFLS